MGRLLLMQVGMAGGVVAGQEGLTIDEIANLAQTLGFETAVTLGATDSSGMVQNDVLTSIPLGLCGVPEDSTNGDVSHPTWHCEEPVSSIVCIHAAAPPTFPEDWLPSLDETRPPTTSPTAQRTLEPSLVPTSSPKNDDGGSDGSDNTGDDDGCRGKPTAFIDDPSGQAQWKNDTQASSQELEALRTSEAFFRTMSYGLILALLMSAAVHIRHMRQQNNAPPKFSRRPLPRPVVPNLEPTDLGGSSYGTSVSISSFTSGSNKHGMDGGGSYMPVPAMTSSSGNGVHIEMPMMNGLHAAGNGFGDSSDDEDEEESMTASLEAKLKQPGAARGLQRFMRRQTQPKQNRSATSWKPMSTHTIATQPNGNGFHDPEPGPADRRGVKEVDIELNPFLTGAFS